MALFVEFPGRRNYFWVFKKNCRLGRPEIGLVSNPEVDEQFCNLNGHGTRHCHLRGSKSVDKLVEFV